MSPAAGRCGQRGLTYISHDGGGTRKKSGFSCVVYFISSCKSVVKVWKCDKTKTIWIYLVNVTTAAWSSTVLGNHKEKAIYNFTHTHTQIIPVLHFLSFLYVTGWDLITACQLHTMRAQRASVPHMSRQRSSTADRASARLSTHYALHPKNNS